jgi:hypothetical protein
LDLDQDDERERKRADVDDEAAPVDPTIRHSDCRTAVSCA